MEWMVGVGWAAAALFAAGYIKNKIGFGKLRGLLGKAHGVILYAQSSLKQLDEMVISAHSASKDGKLTGDELKGVVKEAGEFAQSLKDKTVIDDAVKELDAKVK